MKKFLSIAVMGAAVSAACVTAQANTLLYSFETTSTNTDGTSGPDGFHANGTPAANVAQSTIGASVGSNSLRFTSRIADTYVGVVTSGPNLPAAITAPTTTGISVDVSAQVAPVDNFDDFILVLFGSENGDPTTVDSVQIGYRSVYNVGSTPTAFTFPYAATYTNPVTGLPGTVSTIFGTAPTQLTLTGFTFVLNKPAGLSQTLYLDNVQAIDALPEPSALAVMSVGGMYFMRRRRSI